jgi:hypothetical protein
MWMGEWRQGEHQYKHIMTRRYVILESTTTDAAKQLREAMGGIER